jgi:hypothetical protein
MTAPIAVRVTRYQDPHCGRTHSSRRRAVEHMARGDEAAVWDLLEPFDDETEVRQG